jgi:hypothetical protein
MIKAELLRIPHDLQSICTVTQLITSTLNMYGEYPRNPHKKQLRFWELEKNNIRDSFLSCCRAPNGRSPVFFLIPSFIDVVINCLVEMYKCAHSIVFHRLTLVGMGYYTQPTHPSCHLFYHNNFNVRQTKIVYFQLNLLSVTRVLRNSNY